MKLQQHFRTESKRVTQDGVEQYLEISQWLPPGAPLVSLVKNGSGTTIALKSGCGVQLSDDGQILLAIEAGYPYLEKTQDGTNQEITGHIKPMLHIRNDGWSAKLNLYPPLDGTSVPKPEQILDLMQQADIRSGINEKAIRSGYRKAASEMIQVRDLIIARGRLPVHGQPGKLRMEVALDVRPGKERSDGSIDFKERNMFVAVKKNQLLARQVPATAGMPGLNIFGHEVPQIRGQELVLNPGADLLFDEKSGEIRAAFAGVVSAVGGNAVKVTDRQVIAKDVDYSTGNITSKAAVEIKGTVRSGFSVSADGNVLIGGDLEGGYVDCGANVVVRGGVTGKKSFIRARGEVEILFIEEGGIKSGGSISVARQTYFADLRSDGSITIPSDGKVVASSLLAGASLSLGHVDTPTSPNSKLAAAIDPVRYEKYKKLISQIAEDRKAIAQLQIKLGPDSQAEKLNEKVEELGERLATLKKFNLVPYSPENDRAAGLRYACRQKIIVAGSIQEGSSIRIGNSRIILTQPLKDGAFSLNLETEELIFQPNDVAAKIIILMSDQK